MADDAAKSTVYSVLKACRLVDCFSHAKPELTFSDLVDHSGMNRTTVHRLLSTLERAGWVERVNGRYRLTIRLFQIGSIVSRTLDLRTEARPLLAHLAAELGDTAYLVIVVEDTAVCLDRVEGANPVTVTSKLFNVGQSLPLHVGAAPSPCWPSERMSCFRGSRRGPWSGIRRRPSRLSPSCGGRSRRSGLKGTR